MRRSLLLPLAALLAFAGCDDAAAPEGRPGDVTARVYVDRDASASFTAADSALSGMSVSLTRDGETIATATTDATGLATFQGVEPGSYTVVASGTVPAGTVLVTNPTPSAVVSFQGGRASVDFRYQFFPGSISGRIYREDNNVPGYQAGADAPGGGLWVYLRRDSAGSPGAKIDSVQTAADGAYTFPRLAPGSYFLEFEDPATIDYVGGSMIPVQVQAAQVTSGEQLDRRFTGSLVLTIAEARAKPDGQQVAVVGNVTVAPNTFTSGSGGVNSEIWVQDATGGIAVFSVPSSSPFALGDRLQVVGTTGRFSGQEQLTSPTVTKLSGNTVVQPVTISVPQARALTNDGQLVTVNNLTIASVPTGTSTAYTVTATSSAGDTLFIRVATGTNIARSTFTVGNRYNVTGILTQNGGNAQIKPRGTGDIALGQAVTPIGTLRTQPVGTRATVVGSVTAPPGRFTSGSGGVNSEIWIQDASGGIAVFSVPTADSASIRMGDVLEVTGTTSQFSGQLQIGTPTVTRLRAGTEPAPVVVTGQQVQQRLAEGQVVRLNNFTVTAVGTASTSSGAYTVTGTADGVAGLQIRVIGPTATLTNTGIPTSVWTVGQTYSVTGILTQFNGTAQIKPRQRSDVTP